MQRLLGNCLWEFDSRVVSTLLDYESHIAGSRLVCMTKPTLGVQSDSCRLLNVKLTQLSGCPFAGGSGGVTISMYL